MTSLRSAVVVASVFCIAVPIAGPRAAAAGQTSDAALAAAVQRELSEESDLRGVTATASDGEITLSGRLPTLYLKQDAIERAMDVDGVKTVIAKIELPRVESDENLAFYIGQAVDAYPYQTLFDYIDARIQNGVVTLMGAVTDERNKAEEIAEEVSRVRGVQEIRNEIVRLPPSQGDNRIRAALSDRLLSSIHFEDTARVRNPSFRIVVHNGVVTLYGFVQGETEYRELEQLARFTGGVLRVENKLRTRTSLKK